ncbi:putative l-fucose permease [Rosellinia necatrix]|uniref:Putative l-fucose permease n=1 Tax=Rosellinia necatrix TaxID=77044 RepID=A0A1S8A6S1_ROSNE|nr:putative l-fucose permease [Rosellinia necatrix]
MNSSTPGAWSADGYPDRGPAVFAVTTGTLVLATVFVTARLACRTFIVRQVTWDDYFIIIAWALAFGLSFAIDYGTSKGLGRHDANIKAEDWDALRRSEYTFTVLYVRHSLDPGCEHLA